MLKKIVRRRTFIAKGAFPEIFLRGDRNIPLATRDLWAKTRMGLTGFRGSFPSMK